MEFEICDRELKKIFLDKRALVHAYGTEQADLILMRLAEIYAVDNFEILKKVPGPRLHPLTGNRKGQFSVDLLFPYRLIIEPANDNQSKKPDGTIVWKRVTKVRILEIANTHE